MSYVVNLWLLQLLCPVNFETTNIGFYFLRLKPEGLFPVNFQVFVDSSKYSFVLGYPAGNLPPQ
jgi:hypothetical protein